LANRHSSIKSEFVGLDIEVDMIEYANNKHKKASNVNFIHSNVVEFDFEKADLIVSYYTLQFVRPKVRQLIINKIYNTLNWGGAFICFEKVRGPDARFQDISNQLYTEFKLNNGYSPENIITKSKSLKGVLEPFSTQGNLDLFRRAGFSDITTIMKYICFEGFLMIK
ncbi:MAG: methyltransferase domain-containing protein, partial [Ekhidna sp.]